MTEYAVPAGGGLEAATRTTTYGYDPDGRLIERLAYGPGKAPGTHAPDEQIRYDHHRPTGRLVRTYTGPAAATAAQLLLRPRTFAVVPAGPVTAGGEPPVEEESGSAQGGGSSNAAGDVRAGGPPGRPIPTPQPSMPLSRPRRHR